MFQRTRRPAWMFFCAAALVVLFSLPLAAQQVVGPLVFQDAAGTDCCSKMACKFRQRANPSFRPFSILQREPKS